jgi:hypothetical protein
VARTGRRHRIDIDDAPSASTELNDPNRYGVPRLDANRTEFIP